MEPGQQGFAVALLQNCEPLFHALDRSSEDAILLRTVSPGAVYQEGGCLEQGHGGDAFSLRAISARILGGETYSRVVPLVSPAGDGGLAQACH